MFKKKKVGKINLFPTSINDLKEKQYDDIPLSEEEMLAIQNFDKFRNAYLNASINEEEFDKRYLELQAKANLADYKLFLNII
jgi:folate-dependent tRNA-U54 methylase TrmFO/GidA